MSKIHYRAVNFFSSLLIAFFTLLIALPPQSLSADQCEIAHQAMQAASKIRGLAIKHKVPCLIHNQEQVKAFILETLKTKIPPDKLRFEEVLFKALGFIPDDFDYQKGMVDLYLSQLGGYYDPDRKHFVMAGWMPEIMQPTIAAHELTHALQDQYFNLSKFLDPKSDNSDEQLARSGLVEGDATAVMMDYLRSLGGQPGIAKEQDVNSILLSNVVGMSMTAGLNGVPHALQMMLVFPYTSGLRFAHHVLQTKGSYTGIDLIFRKPPASTEQILHPEKYFSQKSEHTVFSDSDLMPQLISADSKIVHRDTLGEFGVSLLLGNFSSEKLRASEAAAGWGGDRAVVANEGNVQVIAWLTNWDSAKDSDEFFTAFKGQFEQRFRNPKLFTIDGSVSQGETELYRIRLIRDGLRVGMRLERK